MYIKSCKHRCQIGASFVMALATATVWAGDIAMSVEEPSANSTYTGVANIRGWAVGSAGIEFVELYVDGERKTALPLGGRRSDVGTNYPNYPNSNESGFSAAFNYSNLQPGSHTFRVRAVDNDGTNKESSVAFNVVRFDTPYISNPEAVTLSGATGRFGERSINFTNMTADGKKYDVRLEWRTEMQGFAITQISAAGRANANRYQVDAALTNHNCTVSTTPALSNRLRHNLDLEQNAGLLKGTMDRLTETIDQSVKTAGELTSAQGAFWLKSDSVSINVSGSCRADIHDFHYGNLNNGAITVTVNYDYSGNCGAMFDCGASYNGKMSRVATAATLQSLPESASYMMLVPQ